MYIYQYTHCALSQLSTGHLCINSTPQVITNCAPHVVVADLHAALCGSASLESDGSLSTISGHTYGGR